MMRITVFGGSGFLGSHTADKLSDAGHDVLIFDKKESPWLRADQQFMQGSIMDANAIAQAVNKADIVYNYAGIADLADANSRPVDTAACNVLGNVNVLDASRRAGIRRFIFASSLYVYAKSGGFYRVSKQASESFVEMYWQEYGLEYTILRYGSLYGPRADPRNGIYRFVRDAMNKGEIIYNGTPEAVREYIHVEDAALSSVDILDEQYANANIVLTGAQAMRVSDLFKMVGEILGKQLTIKYITNDRGVHYDMTPYSFNPRLGKKMFPRHATDLGQGILDIMNTIYHGNHPSPELDNG